MDFQHRTVIGGFVTDLRHGLWLVVAIGLALAIAALMIKGAREQEEGSSALFPIRKAEGWGLISAAGIEVVRPRWKMVQRVDKRRFFVRDSNRMWGIAEEGRVTVAFERSGEAVGWRFLGDGLFEFSFSREAWLGYRAKAASNGDEYMLVDTNAQMQLGTGLVVAGPISEGLIAVWENGSFGYADRHGNVVVSPRFEAADVFSEGLAAVKEDGQLRYIDCKGQVVLSPDYSDGSQFQEGFAVVSDETGIYYMRRDGTILKLPVGVVPSRMFSEGLAVVLTANGYGFIDSNGRWGVTPRYTRAASFSEGLAFVEENNRSAFIRPSGDCAFELPDVRVIQPLPEFSNGLAWVRTEPDSVAKFDPFGFYVAAGGTVVWRSND